MRIRAPLPADTLMRVASSPPTSWRAASKGRDVDFVPIPGRHQRGASRSETATTIADAFAAP